MSDADYFSTNYDEARARFREAAGGLGELSSFTVPSTRDSDLTVEYLCEHARRSKETLLVLTSGVHGSEGFTGSAIQLMFLKELWQKIPRETCGTLLVHSLNPFGFKFHRRSTESNVNLNRNFGADESLFATKNNDYERLAPLLESRKPAGSTPHSLLSAAKFVGSALAFKGFTAETLNRTIAHGQFRHPQGLEFGGKTWEPQIKDFIERLRAASAEYRNLVIFDLHTGLGDRYELHLIPVDEPKSRDETLMKRLFRPDEEKALYRITDPTQPGFYETAGDLNSLPPQIAVPGQKTLTLTFEYGTLGNTTFAKIDSLARLLQENRGYHAGYRSEKTCIEARRSFQEMFAPSEPHWRENAVSRARSVLSLVTDRLSLPA